MSARASNLVAEAGAGRRAAAPPGSCPAFRSTDGPPPADFRPCLGKSLPSTTHTASGCPQPGRPVLLEPSHRRVVPGGGGEESLHGPCGDAHRFGEILGVAPVLGLHQEAPEIVLAVVPRLPAPEQRNEVSVKVHKGLVHLLESRLHPSPFPICSGLP